MPQWQFPCSFDFFLQKAEHLFIDLTFPSGLNASVALMERSTSKGDSALSLPALVLPLVLDFPLLFLIVATDTLACKQSIAFSKNPLVLWRIIWVVSQSENIKWKVL